MYTHLFKIGAHKMCSEFSMHCDSGEFTHGVHPLYFFFFRTYFDNIVAIDSLLEHIMVGLFGFDGDFLKTLIPWSSSTV